MYQKIFLDGGGGKWLECYFKEILTLLCKYTPPPRALKAIPDCLPFVNHGQEKAR